jgi:hypothetical protein
MSQYDALSSATTMANTALTANVTHHRDRFEPQSSAMSQAVRL